MTILAAKKSNKALSIIEHKASERIKQWQGKLRNINKSGHLKIL